MIRQALADDMPSMASSADAWENDRLVDRAAAMQRAAALLRSGRRVLVTGLAGATLESIVVACDLAEVLGAAVDAGLPESARAAGPAIARVGEVTAGWEECRDRADLVIFWCCDPAGSHPRFIERFIAPALADGRQRRTITVGPVGALPAASGHRHLPLSRDLAVEAARCLQMLVAGQHLPSAESPLAAVCAEIEKAVRSADCVAIVTADADDPVGLESWSIVHLVRTVAHERPAFQIPLGAGLVGGGRDAGDANPAGAATACTWRYGAAGAIARADRAGSLFLPAESDARRLIDRGEVDAVLILGRLRDSLHQAITRRGDLLSRVQICDASQPGEWKAGRRIQFRCASGAIASTGTMLREDGRRIALVPTRRSVLPQMRDLLVDLSEAVRRASTVAGGHP